MGRQIIGNTNVKLSELYSTCWRKLQLAPLNYTRETGTGPYGSGTATVPQNLSLCKFAQYSSNASPSGTPAYPWVNGALKTSENLGIGSLPLNQYLYFQSFKFAGTANGTLTITWPNAATYPYDYAYRSTSTNNAEIGFPYQFFQNATSYFTITFVANTGYQLGGYYTSKIGGSLITSSTSFNFSYNGASSGASSQGRWWVRTEVIPASTTSYTSSTMGVFNQACSFSGFNPCCTQTYYHDGTGTLPAQGDGVFSNSAGTTSLSDGYYNINASTGVGNRLYIKVVGGVVALGYPDLC